MYEEYEDFGLFDVFALDVLGLSDVLELDVFALDVLGLSDLLELED